MKNRTKRLMALLITTSAMVSSCGGSYYEVSDMIKNANEYIESEIANVNNERKGKYHLSSPIGWMNDPNGLCQFNSTFHAFYQYNPYEAKWGPMHWGHQTSKDLIKWEREDVALAPDEQYDNGGCFSGSTLIENGKMYLAYTCVSEGLQNQAMAISSDGKVFQKLKDNPIIDGDDLPEGFSNVDFRDPKISKIDGKYYIITGNRDESGNKQIIIFESDSPIGKYTYKGVIYSRTDVGGIFECPDMVEMGKDDILVACPQSFFNDNPYELQNVDSPIYMVGNLSTNSYKFFPKLGAKEFDEFDKGFSFYAPQCFKAEDGRTILMAWMKNWQEANVTYGDGWAGSLTLPRELTLKDSHIYQKPVKEIYNYLGEEIKFSNQELSSYTYSLTEDTVCRLSLDIIPESGKTGIEVFKGSGVASKIYYDSDIGCVVLDRDNAGGMLDGIRYAKVDPIEGKIHLEIFLDVNSVEVFINDGYYTMTANIFSNLENREIAIYNDGGKGTISNIVYNHLDI